jgi:16S rRNA G966 N2-methylase RsmD
MYSISTPKKADIISRIISDGLQKYVPAKKLVITDAMAGVGGNLISFSRHFAHVNAVEVDPIRFSYMVSNTHLFNCKNISTLQCSYLDVYQHMRQDVIFIDPPWGGKNYKSYSTINITIDDMSIEALCKNIIECKLCRLLVLKLPKNIDLALLNAFTKYKIYDLKKMMLVLIYSSW